MTTFPKKTRPNRRDWSSGCARSRPTPFPTTCYPAAWPPSTRPGQSRRPSWIRRGRWTSRIAAAAAAVVLIGGLAILARPRTATAAHFLQAVACRLDRGARLPSRDRDQVAHDEPNHGNLVRARERRTPGDPVRRQPDRRRGQQRPLGVPLGRGRTPGGRLVHRALGQAERVRAAPV